MPPCSSIPGADEIAKLRDALRRAPRALEIHRLLGLALWRNGELLEALVAMRKVHRLNPADRESLYAQAAISRERGHFGKAFEILYDLLHPDHSPCATRGPFPDFPSPYDGVDWEELFDKTRTRILGDGGYIERALKEGQLCLEQKCYDKAIRIYTRLSALKPREPEFRLRRAVALSARRRDTEAEKELSEVLLIQPLSAPAYKGLAVIRARRGDHEMARTAFEQVLKIDPTDVDARRWLEGRSREVA